LRKFRLNKSILKKLYTLNCKGRLINLATPRIMGILNRTPDSFYEGGRSNTTLEILQRAGRMLDAGATFLDVGGYSSRPGAKDISIDEELDRVLPAIEAIIDAYPNALISVDTFRAEVAKKAVEAGAAMVNDISGGTLDTKMLNTIAQLQVPYVMMHIKGSPQNMQSKTDYKNLTGEVLLHLSQRIRAAREVGINDLICDPGFGFAKTREQNFELLRDLNRFNLLDCPLLVGVSRKSMIYKSLDTTAENALNGSTFLHGFALQGGAHILRVHDVSEAVECVQLWTELRKGD